MMGGHIWESPWYHQGCQYLCIPLDCSHACVCFIHFAGRLSDTMIQYKDKNKKKQRKSLVTLSSGLNPFPDDVLVRSQDKTDFLPTAMLLVLVGT